MNFERVSAVARAVLYEGYLLYPYRSSSVKNQQRWNFGVLLPPAACDPDSSDRFRMQTECLVTAEPASAIEVRARFLQLAERQEGSIGQEASERDFGARVTLAELLGEPKTIEFESHAQESSEAGEIWLHQPLQGKLTLSAQQLGEAVRIRAIIENSTVLSPAKPVREAALASSFISTHTLFGLEAGRFISLLEPPDAFVIAAKECENIGTWPVLVGEDAVLSSPIILYDQPEIAAESPGDLFDATEIDEILTLRILTLTDEEKREMRKDPRARTLLERTEGLGPAELARLHGVIREWRPSGPGVPKVGDEVRLCPRRRADVFDVALAGKLAKVVGVERDFEGRTLLAVTIADDPGCDLGLSGQPGHRFFFHDDEVEPTR